VTQARNLVGLFIAPLNRAKVEHVGGGARRRVASRATDGGRMTQGEHPTPEKRNSLDGIRRPSLLTLLVLLKGEQRAKRVWHAFRDSLGRNASVHDIERQLLQPIRRRTSAGFLTPDESHYLISDVVSRNVG
jgi:hypothetical protein